MTTQETELLKQVFRDPRWELCQAIVTLDGYPAKISGRYNPFASVWMLHTPDVSVDFSWDTVAAIVANGGKFRS